MTGHDSSIGDAVRSAVRDAQDLVRGEIELAKAEAKQEVGRLARGTAYVAAAALTAILGLGLLAVTLAFGVSQLAGWPDWAGFALVTAVLLLVAAGLGMAAKRRFGTGRHMPRTIDTLKENVEWMRARTS